MNIEEIKKKAIQEISGAKSLKELERIRIKYLGREGELNKVLKSLKNLTLEEKREVSPKANKLKDELLELVSEKQTKLVKENKVLIDATKPGKRIQSGHLHPLTKIEQEICDIFRSMNFSVVDGPEVENEYYNFDALNIPPNHPARDEWDTFWISKAKIPERVYFLELILHRFK